MQSQLPHTKKKTLPKLFDFDDESFESIRETTGSLSRAVGKDVVKDGAKNALQQLLGKYEETAERADRLAGELAQGQELDLAAAHGKKSEKAPAPKRHDIQPGLEQYNYHRDIVHASEKASHQENRELSQQVEQIMVEIQRLISSSAVLETQFAAVAVEQKPKEVGKYHTHFFEWMLITIRNARAKVEDSGAWLATMSGKKGKKGNYWSEFKKHGTSFGMSNERSVATQTG